MKCKYDTESFHFKPQPNYQYFSQSKLDAKKLGLDAALVVNAEMKVKTTHLLTVTAAGF